MIRKLYFTIALVLIAVTLLHSINIAESVKTGDKLEYSFRMIFNYRGVMPKSPQEWGVTRDFVECNFNWNLTGVMVYEVVRITSEEMSIKVTYRDIEVFYSVKCNDTETETQLKQQLVESIRRMREELRKPMDLSFPLIYRFNETLIRTPLSPLQVGIPITGPVTSIGTGSQNVPNLEFNYTVVKTTYRNRPSLLIEAQGEFNQVMFGIQLSLRGSGQTYTDLTGNIVYYSIGEGDFQISFPTASEAVSPQSLSGSVKVELELMNIDQLARYRTIGLELRFRENRGELYISGYEIRLNNYRVDGRKLVLNITGLGLGGVFINLTRGVSVLDISIDKARAKYISEEVGEGSLIRVPIVYSSHIVEIEFSEEVSEVKEMEPVRGALENFIILSLIVVIVVVPLAIVLYILKRLKKTAS